MSYIPGTELHHGYDAAPKALRGKNYKKYNRARARHDKEHKLANMISQNHQYAKQMHASLALRANFLKQQQSSNVLNEMIRNCGILDQHRQYRLSDGRSLDTRLQKLSKYMDELKPQLLAGAEGLYMYYNKV